MRNARALARFNFVFNALTHRIAAQPGAPEHSGRPPADQRLPEGQAYEHQCASTPHPTFRYPGRGRRRL